MIECSILQLGPNCLNATRDQLKLNLFLNSAEIRVIFDPSHLYQEVLYCFNSLCTNGEYQRNRLSPGNSCASNGDFLRTT